jgi:hypothetical protein
MGMKVMSKYMKSLELNDAKYQTIFDIAIHKHNK